MFEKVPVQRLTMGMYVSLTNIPWYKHPFLRSSFEITKPSEIRDILALGYETIMFDPDKSKARPLTKDMNAKIKPPSEYFTREASLKAKKASELRKRRRKFREMEQRFHDSLQRTTAIIAGLRNRQIEFYQEIKTVAHEMADIFTRDVNLSVEHINVSANDDGQHYHSLNVMVLSMMLGKQIGLNRETLEQLSFGALVHDIGLTEPIRKISPNDPKKKERIANIRNHPMGGVRILSSIPDLSPEAMKIVYQHHENCDGSGYPKGLKGNQISPLAKITAVVDAYDRLINTRDPKKALSPHKALAYMFGKKKDCFDPELLNTFIKMLGVFPAGTACRFTSGDVGVILSADPDAPMHPELIIYDPAIPKHDAIIYKLGIDLDLTIETTLGMSELDFETLSYLDSRAAIQYFPSEKG